METRSERETTLRNIFSVAEGVKAFLGSQFGHSPPSAIAATIPPLELPFPDDISMLLASKGFSEFSVVRISQKYHAAATALREVHTENYQKTCQKVLASTPPRLPGQKPVSLLADLRRAFHDSYLQHHLPEMMERVLFLNAAIYKPQQRTNEKRRTFNNEYTPLLEKYFEYNAYPSAPDRLVLARKSMMTPRQIEVWFQNHRTRSKKEGRPLRRMNLDSIPLELSIKTLEQAMPSFFLSINERKQPVGIEATVDEGTGEHSPPAHDISNPPFSFDSPAPPHAFPSPFPSNCGYNPFPHENNTFRFPAPLWDRIPACTTTTPASIDVDELVTLFTLKLHLREGTLKKRPPCSQLSASSLPWFSATVTKPLPAPLPSLIRTTTLTTNPLHDHAPLPLAQPTTLRSTYPMSTDRKVRKVAHLPRRSPLHSSVAHPVSTTHASPTPLFTSLPSPGSRSTSTSSSCSSSSSSTPGTPSSSPIISPTNLDPPAKPDLPQTVFSQIYSYLPAELMLPSTGLRINLAA